MQSTQLASQTLGVLVKKYPILADFMVLQETPPVADMPLGQWIAQLPEEALLDMGMGRTQLLDHLQQVIAEVSEQRAALGSPVRSLTLMGGQDKQGRKEVMELTFKAGEVVCIVGPTGAGKSRLLGDIECLAQGDTPSGRHVLINGQRPEPARRHAPDRKLVAQLSQNMNFVVDLSAQALIQMHARCRQVSAPELMAERVISCANELTGEKFDPAVPVTQLSGGQTRALMIADVALLSASPIVLIDEIENAGVDRHQALALLTGGDKIVLVSTHDPLLALRGVRRLVVHQGGIVQVIETSAAERANLARIEAMDNQLMAIRERLRCGLRLEEVLPWC